MSRLKVNCLTLHLVLQAHPSRARTRIMMLDTLPQEVQPTGNRMGIRTTTTLCGTTAQSER